MPNFYKTLNELEKQTNKFHDELPTTFSIKKILAQEDIPLVSELAAEAWGDESFYAVTRLSLFNKWHEANSNIFSLIFEGDEAIGYINVLPLKTDKHFNSEISRVNIDRNKSIVIQDNRLLFI